MTRSRAEIASLSSDIRALLVRRADRIRRPSTEADARADAQDALWVALFSLGDCEYAIALPTLRAAMLLRSVTPVPRSSRFVIGVLQFQGEVIAALSTGALLSGGWDVDPMILLVVDAGGGRNVALDCAQVPVATALPLSAYREAQATMRGALTCVAVPGRGSVNVIDLARLLDLQDWDARNA